MNNKRAMYILAVFCLLFITLIGYMTYIEVKHGEEYNNMASNPRNAAKDLTTLRGSIFGADGEILAYSENKDGGFKRIYPFDNLYSHVIGYVSKDYGTRTLIEAQYNSELLGTSMSNDISDIVNSVNTKTEKGNDLVLTVNHELQKAAYSAMGNHDGAIVALNPKTGEILAMVSKPDYNPNSDSFEDDLKDTALYSRAIQFLYPPGSSFKTVSTAAILDSRLDDETYDDQDGQYVIKSADGNPENDYICRNEDARHAYGLTDLEKAFTVSSNVYFAHLSTLIETKKFQNIAEKFMFNKTIDFDLPIKQSVFQQGKMTDADRIMASIGQGQTEATPIHMALIAATIANDGVMPKPYIVSKIKSGSLTKFSAKPGSIGRIISKEDAKIIKDLMKSVVDEGTGRSAAIPGIEVCGKTGTSENSLTATGGANSGKTHSVFIGFAPYDNPEIAICVIKEYAGFGASYAAPAAKSVMQKYFEIYK